MKMKLYVISNGPNFASIIITYIKNKNIELFIKTDFIMLSQQPELLLLLHICFLMTRAQFQFLQKKIKITKFLTK